MKRSLVIMGITYGLYAAMLFLGQRQAAFPGQRLETPPLPTVGSSATLYRLTTSGGNTEAWFLPPLEPGASHPAPVVMFFHGNYELVDHWFEDLEVPRQLGLAVMLVEYPGYGRSEGSPTQESMTESAVAAYDSLIARPDVDADRIVAYGRSLGGGVACALADRRNLSALVLQSTFASLRAFARQFWVPSLLVRDPFDNVAVLEELDAPVLILHGVRDDQIPVAHATALAGAARNSTLMLTECQHDDCPPSWEKFWLDVTTFLRDNGVLDSGGSN